MAFPIIVIDSNSGSDTAASGAGPTTALTGTAASTSSDGLTVTLDGSPSLTNVATDGSHVIYLADATAGNRNFAAIVGKDTGAHTVTVDSGQAFGTSLSGKSWAIGGKRASINATSSRKLVDNNGTTADAMPGWTIGMAGGHTETLTSTLTLRRGGDYTTGRITLKGLGDPMPEINQTNTTEGTYGIYLLSKAWGIQYLKFNGPAAWSGVAIGGGSTTVQESHWISQIRITHGPTYYWARGIADLGPHSWIERCHIEECYEYGIQTPGDHSTIVGCFVRGCASGIGPYSSLSPLIIRNVIVNSSTAAINHTASNSSAKLVFGNTLYNSTAGTSAGISYYADPASIMYRSVFSNNIIYGFATGLSLYGSPQSPAALAALNVRFDNNLFYGNTANVTSGYEALLVGSTTDVDPSFADPTTTFDFAPGTGVVGLGWPDYTLDGTATRSYVDPGAVQTLGGSGGTGGNGGSGLPASRIFTGM